VCFTTTSPLGVVVAVVTVPPLALDVPPVLRRVVPLERVVDDVRRTGAVLDANGFAAAARSAVDRLSSG
jgi:hypothetical protein